MINYYNRYADKIHKILSQLLVTKGEGVVIEPEAGLSLWCDITKELKAKNATMFLIGNGASAMMASHMAADASKNGEIRAIAFNDAALLTAVSNDISYNHSFSMPLKRFANPGDTLVTISSSGNSPNVIEAAQAAKTIGLTVVTLSAMKPDNKSRSIGDLNFFVPANTYGLAEICHQALLHCWLDRFREELIED